MHFVSFYIGSTTILNIL